MSAPQYMYSQSSIPDTSSALIQTGLAKVWHLLLSDTLTTPKALTLTKIETIASTFWGIKAWEDANTAAFKDLKYNPPEWHDDHQKRLERKEVTLQQLYQQIGLATLDQIIHCLKQDARSSELAAILERDSSKLRKQSTSLIPPKRDKMSLSAIENLTQAYRIFTLMDPKSCEACQIRTFFKLVFGGEELSKTLKTFEAPGDEAYKEAGKVGWRVMALRYVRSARALLKLGSGAEYAALLDWAGEGE